MKSRWGMMWRRAAARAAMACALLTGWGALQAQTSTQVVTTTVQGTVYQASGQPGQGTLLIRWPAFVTAANQAVAAGSLSVTVGADGFASVNLAPNQGASPAGTYYTVVYHLTGQTASTEYWTVPAAASATIAAVRAQVEPATVAVQTVSKAYVDNLVATMTPTAANYLPLVGGTLSGPLALAADPASTTQAANKHYVDTAVATAVPLTGGVVSGTLAIANAIAKLPRVDVRSADFAGGADPTGKADSTAAFQAAIAFAQASSPSKETNYPVIYVPDGHYLINGTLRLYSGMRLEGDGRDNTYLQETNATANLITVVQMPVCSVATCYGAIQHMTLEGSGKATIGALLELDTGDFVLRDLMFVNSGGRGLQMNGASERVGGYDLSFYFLRWPMILAGDSNEDYFYNTHVIAAGTTEDAVSNRGYVNYYCYSINCVAGNYPYAGTTSAPTTILPDPHASIYVDKSVNVSFIGGSVKASYMQSGVKVWGAGPVRFQNFYHEDVYYGGAPAINRAYIVGGQGEQTYLTGTLSATGTQVSVNDASWMPQEYGLAADAASDGAGDYYPYVILPQDYNRASTAPSAYVSGLNQNQYEIVSVNGYTPDNTMYIGGRHEGGTAPAGTQWPAGSVVEELPTANPSLELEATHINQVQGPLTGNGWTAGCNETNVYACGEIVLGYTPDIENPTATPSTNQVGYYAPLNDPNDPMNGATANLMLRQMDMFSSASNPYQGSIVGEHRSTISLVAPANTNFTESTTAMSATALGKQISIANLTGGAFVIAPKYANGTIADVRFSAPGSGEQWDTYNGLFWKNASVYLPYQQWGFEMNGFQYQDLYCMFDSPTTDGGSVQNRVCLGGGPSNTANNGTGYGGGLEVDSWNSTTQSFVDMFKVYGNQGVGQVTAGAPMALGSTLNVTGAATFVGAVNAVASEAVGGALTAATVNRTVTVDGVTYKTLNAAWTAAVAQATTTGTDQTIWLGPGAYPVSATMTEPTNGACVSVVGSAGATTGADIGSTATTLTVPSQLNGDVFYLGNTSLTEGCTFKDLNVLAGKNATHGFEMQWARGLLLDTVEVNDTTAEGVLIGEEAANGHQTNTLLRNVTVSYSSSAFAPSARPAWGVHLQKTAIDSVMHTVTVRNALTAAVWNEGTGNLGYSIHGFGYPYTCTTAPCSNTATSGTAANASYASNYVVYDTGGAGSTWTDTYADSPAVSAFYIAANGTEVRGGHVQWPDLTSFPSANFASVTAGVTNNLLIADVSCLGMSSSVNWINYASASGVPPTFASVHHLTGCGNYYQALEPATTTGFSGGGASNNAPGNGAVAAVWAAPKAGASTYSAYSAQEYTGYQGDLFDGHIAGQMPFFNITYQGTIRTAGGIALSTMLNTAPTLALTTANKNVIANAASGAQTITLPSCYTAMPDKAAPTGLELTVVKSDMSSNAVTVTTVSSQTINYQGTAAGSLVIPSAGKRTLVCAPDNNWYAY